MVTVINEPFGGKLITDDTIVYSLMALEAADDIAVDTETSGLDVRNNVDYLMGVCVDVPGLSAYMPFRHRADNISMRYVPHLVRILEQKPLIWHNRKFDMHAFKTLGVDPLRFKGPQYDTMMIAQLINEEWYSKELDALAKLLLKKEKFQSDVVHKLGSIHGYANLPAEVHKNYGSFDAVLTRELRDYLWPMLCEQELASVYWDTEAPFTALLYSLEQRGVGTNPDFCARKAELGHNRMDTIQRRLQINPASPLDLKRYLLDELNLPVLAHTDSCDQCKINTRQGKRPQDHLHLHEGKPSFNKKAMEDYDDILQASENPAAKLISEYRGWQKAVSSLYEPLLKKVGPDGKIRTEFKQHGTVTGRLSASNPNLQQVPRGSSKSWNGNAKSAFNSGRPGFLLYGWDYSQVELRLAAAYGQEKVLLTEFESESADPFNVLAPIIFGKLTPETRHDTKTFVYANLYGAGLPKISLQLGRSLEETRGLYENYKRGIPGIINISSQVSELVAKRGFIRYWDGRRRHIRNRGDSYKAWNSLCQGGAAQLVKKAMLRCQEIEDDNCFMVLQVHDEITFCIKEDLIPQYEPLIVKAMTDFPDFGVRFAVEGKEWK